MLDNEVISEVLFRMIGEIHPIQETNYDDKAYENQEKIMFIIDRCIDEVIQQEVQIEQKNICLIWLIIFTVIWVSRSRKNK